MIATLVRRLIGARTAPEFRHQELVGLFAAMRDAGIASEPVKRFARRLARPSDGGASEGFGLLRFDIHGNMDRPLRVAQDLSALGMTGLFLPMHRHPVNQGIYDSRTTWDSLKKITDLGHEVGLHFDPFYLIRAHGDLYAGLGAALEEFAQRGVKVQSASVHGDTRTHIKECGLQSNDFFAEGFRLSKWNGEPPKGEEFLAEHVRRYSQAKIAEDHGIHYFVEPNFSHLGRLVTAEGPAYLSDNRRQIRINNLVDRHGTTHLTAPEPFRISHQFAEEVALVLKTRPFLALMHPQWYA